MKFYYFDGAFHIIFWDVERWYYYIEGGNRGILQSLQIYLLILCFCCSTEHLFSELNFDIFVFSNYSWNIFKKIHHAFFVPKPKLVFDSSCSN